MNDDAGNAAQRRRRKRVARQAFLLELSDTLRPLADPAAIQSVAVRALGEALHVDRALYAEVSAADGHVFIADNYTRGDFPRMTGRFPLTAYGLVMDTLRAGETLAIGDVRVEPGLGDADRAALAAAGVAAIVAVPLIRNGRRVATLDIHQGAARAWTRAEIALVRETAERTWAAVERARADAVLRESDSRYRSLFRSMGEGLCVMEVLPDPDTGAIRGCRILETNPAFDEAFGLALRDRAGAALPEDLHWLGAYARAAATGTEQRFTAHLPGNGRSFDVRAFRVDDARARKVAVLFTDVTRSRAAEQVLRWNQLRQQALLEFGDAARATTDARLIVAMAARLIGLRLGADRAGYAEIDREHALCRVVDAWSARPDIPAIEGSFPLAAVGRGILRELRQGRLVAVDDLTSDPRLAANERSIHAHAQIAAFVAAPLLRREGLRAVLFVHQRVPRTWTAEERELVSEFGLRTWAELDRARAEDALRSSEERFRQFAEASSDMIWIRDAQTLRFEFVSPAFESIYGARREDVLGRDLSRSSALILPADRRRVLSNLRRVSRGRQVMLEFRIVRADTGRQRWVRDTAFPLIAPDGKVRRIGGIRQDVTDEKETADRQRVLVAELQHRTRNLIAVVRALADKTMQDHAADGAFARVFGERLDALARAQGLLSRLDGQRKVNFGDLLKAELAAQAAFAGEGGQVQVAGPDGVRLRSRSVQILALALHELCTNAVKYGALSGPDGRLRIRWQVERDAAGVDWLHVDWRESGVELAQDAGTRQGYGRELIERALPFQLGARTTFGFTPDGVHCTIAVPVAHEGEDA